MVRKLSAGEARMTEVRAEIVLPTSDLRQDLPFFTKVLGMRMDMIYPADNPAVAVMSGHGLRVQLDAGSTAAPGHLRILTDDASFAGGKRALPFLTVAMLAISDFIRGWGWLLALAIAGGVGLLVVARRNAATRERLDALFLTFPLVGKLARGYNAARFAGTLAMLAGSGVPILKALQAAAETLSNAAMRADAMDALVQVREGAPLASALAAKKRFPGLLSMFARLGEQTGELPLMLQRAATQLSAEVQRRAMQLATILEPLLIVVMGAMVMLIVLAVLMPIIQLNTWVK